MKNSLEKNQTHSKILLPKTSDIELEGGEWES